jgi:hypothetical protein
MNAVDELTREDIDRSEAEAFTQLRALIELFDHVRFHAPWGEHRGRLDRISRLLKEALT